MASPSPAKGDATNADHEGITGEAQRTLARPSFRVSGLASNTRTSQVARTRASGRPFFDCAMTLRSSRCTSCTSKKIRMFAHVCRPLWRAAAGAQSKDGNAASLCYEMSVESAV